MRSPAQLPKNNPADLQRLDSDYRAEYAAGTIPVLEVPPLDLSADPFGRGFSWLNVPAHPYDATCDALADKDPVEWYRSGGLELRRAALAGSFAAGSDEEIFRKWSRENFAALCFSAGEDGDDLLDSLKSDGEINPELVYRVATLLESQPSFAELTAEQRAVAAMIAIDSFRPRQSE